MRRKIIKQLIAVFFLSAIPSLLSYLASSSLIFDKMIQHGLLGNSINVELVQDYCLWIGIVVSAVFLSFNLLVTKVKYDHILQQRNSLIKTLKYILASAIGKQFTSDPSSFDIRFFIPKHPFIYKIADRFNISKLRKSFIIKNLDLIADQGLTKNLEFEVYPKCEGLVGICYQSQSMVMDDDLENTNDKKYDLSQNQIDRTSNLKWSICYPILDDNNNVVAIIALDGQSRINIDNDKQNALKQNIISFSRLLYDSAPQLFRRSIRE